MRPSVDAAGEAGDPTSDGGEPRESIKVKQPLAFPAKPPLANGEADMQIVPEREGTLPAAPPRGMRATPRGPRAKRAARAGAAGAGAKVESTDWERNKLLELMQRTEVEGMEV